MKLTVLALQGLAQPAKVGVAILVIEEAGPAVVATLYDVQRDTVDVNARTPEHDRSLAEIEPGSFLGPLRRIRVISAPCSDAAPPPAPEARSGGSATW
jgi:hypothetical protein